MITEKKEKQTADDDHDDVPLAFISQKTFCNTKALSMRGCVYSQGI